MNKIDVTVKPPRRCMIQFSCGRWASSGGSFSDHLLKLPEEGSSSNSSNRGGIKFDSRTELQTGFRELMVGNVYIVDGNDKIMLDREVVFNTKFSIVYEGVKNYVLDGGMAFPNLSIQVSDNNKNPIVSAVDLLAAYPGGLIEADASILRATVVVGVPMKQGDYNCTVAILDKNNTSAAIVSTWSFKVK